MTHQGCNHPTTLALSALPLKVPHESPPCRGGHNGCWICSFGSQLKVIKVGRTGTTTVDDNDGVIRTRTARGKSEETTRLFFFSLSGQLSPSPNTARQKRGGKASLSLVLFPPLSPSLFPCREGKKPDLSPSSHSSFFFSFLLSLLFGSRRGDGDRLVIVIVEEHCYK